MPGERGHVAPQHGIQIGIGRGGIGAGHQLDQGCHLARHADLVEADLASHFGHQLFVRRIGRRVQQAMANDSIPRARSSVNWPWMAAASGCCKTEPSAAIRSSISIVAAGSGAGLWMASSKIFGRF